MVRIVISTFGFPALIGVLKMDCFENQYYESGGCHSCVQCSPGQELTEVNLKPVFMLIYFFLSFSISLFI